MGVFERGAWVPLVCGILGMLGAAQEGFAETTGTEIQSRPNIVLIISDDHRWDCIGAAGNPRVKTPHLDEMAREGVYFKQATVATPQCSPNRALILTGMPPHQNGWLSNQSQRPEVKQRDAYKNIPTLPGVLRDGGYETVLVGKWHLASEPWNSGFTTVRKWLPGGGGPYRDVKLATGNSRETTPTQGFLQDIFGQDAADYIKSRNAQKPFMLWLALTAPHTPLRPNPESASAPYIGMDNSKLVPLTFTQGTPEEHLTSFTVYNRRKGGGGERKAKETMWHDYYAAITSADEQVGRVRRALREAGADKNTIIIFIGDNGMMRGSRGWEGKVLPYEESVRVPMVVYAPGVAKFTGTSQACVSSLDLPVSIPIWAGIAPPKAWSGRDITPALQKEDSGIAMAFAEYADNHSNKFGPIEYRMVRTPDAKLIKWRNPDFPAEYYDLKKDPRELTNLANSPDAKADMQKLEAELKGWQEQTQDKYHEKAELVSSNEED